MSWVALERAVRIARQTGHPADIDDWSATMAAIHAEVMERGWSDHVNVFTQRYDADTLDAAALLIPVMEFLPADHPQVQATVDRIVERLAINGFVHRFIPAETPGHADLPLGEFEGAFLPCTFWLATTFARSGRADEAEAILRCMEQTSGDLGIFAEEIDARTGAFLGNSPLLFSHVEYVRAVMELANACPLDKPRTMIGMLEEQVKRMVGRMAPNSEG